MGHGHNSFWFQTPFHDDHLIAQMARIVSRKGWNAWYALNHGWFFNVFIHFFLNYCFLSNDKPRMWILMIYFCFLTNNWIILHRIQKKDHHSTLPPVLLTSKSSPRRLSMGSSHCEILLTEKKQHSQETRWRGAKIYRFFYTLSHKTLYKKITDYTNTWILKIKK